MGSRTHSRTRADQVRQRRKKQGGGTGRRVTSRRKRRQKATSLPPVVVRRGNLPIDLSVRRRGHTRRRYDIALGIPGAEVRLPVLPAIRFGWRTLSGCLVAGLLVLLYTLLNSPTYHVKAAEVFGIERLTSQEVNTVMKVAGESIFSVEPRRMEADLQAAFPELFDITVQVGFPAVVRVKVNERQPVLTWQQGGMTLWVDEQGVAFPPRGETGELVAVEALDTPLVRIQPDEKVQAFIEPELIPAILVVGENTPADTAVLFDAQYGLGWRDPQGWRVFFGPSGTEMETRLKVYHALTERLAQDQITPTLISVEYLHAPYYRLDR